MHHSHNRMAYLIMNGRFQISSTKKKSRTSLSSFSIIPSLVYFSTDGWYIPRKNQIKGKKTKRKKIKIIGFKIAMVKIVLKLD